MTRFWLSALLLMTLCSAAPPALAAFIFRVGDTVYVDGRQFSWEQWKKIRDTYQPEAPVPAAPAIPAQGARAASCVTSIYYDEFPSEDERFGCSAGLGALTREEILRSGWKIDLIEKIPSPPGGPAQSPRGLPLSLYKLVISRSAAPPAAPRANEGAGRVSQRQTDVLCMSECLGTGGNRDFCQDRCTN